MLAYPKIELHCHLDGSLRPETVVELAEAIGLTLTIDEAKDELIAPLECDSLDTYLKRFALPVKLMQTEEVLKRIAYELMEDAAKENVKYLEIRFAPQLHVEKGLSYDQIIGAVVGGIKAAEKDFEIKGNIILSYMRNTDVEGIYDVIEAGKPYIDNGVVALDLCAGERDFFCERFVDAFAHARTLGYHVTIHAGETGINENIEDAVKLLKAERIGHGVAMMAHPETRTLLIESGVMVESCPTSNVQTKAVETMKDHPFKAYFDEAIIVGINTDNRTVSNTTMTTEYERLAREFALTAQDFQKIYDKTIDASFADEATKEWLRTFKKA